jgi:hypothetical protein
VWDCRYENDCNDGLTCAILCYVSVMWTPTYVRQRKFNELSGDILHAKVATTGPTDKRTTVTRTQPLVRTRQRNQTDRCIPGLHITDT